MELPSIRHITPGSPPEGTGSGQGCTVGLRGAMGCWPAPCWEAGSAWSPGCWPAARKG